MKKGLIKVRRLKKMDKYIIVTTFCNKEEIANNIINILLDKKLVAGTQISKVHSKYWWNNELEEFIFTSYFTSSISITNSIISTREAVC